MNNENITKNTLIEQFTGYVIDEVNEIINYEFDNFKDSDLSKSEKIGEVEGYIHDEGRFHAIVDQSQEVIYTYQAKQVCDVLDIDIFGESEMTGERYESWSHAAFDGLYSMIYENIDLDEIINEAILKLNK